MKQSDNIAEKIKKLSEAFAPDIIEHRRHFHRFPELSFGERETSAYIRAFLRKLGIPFKSGFGGYGIVASLSGSDPSGRVLALRADMDALPVEEKTGLPYASVNQGIMHACGHDVHMASLMGTIIILNEIRSQWKGTVLFVFQPGEEKLPGGARAMLEEGALKDPVPDMVIGQHVLPGMPAGNLGFRPGPYMASSDEIYVTVNGRGGHAAMPAEIINPILIASRIVVSLMQTAGNLNRKSPPSVLSFGRIIGDGATNVVPDKVGLEGTFRSMNEKWREKMHHKIAAVARSIAEGMGGTCEVEIRKGYPVLENHPGVTRKAMEFARLYLGREKTEEIDIRMTAEDFAYFARAFPATFYRLGAGNTKPLHSPFFSPDEAALTTGSGAMAWIACCFLTEKTPGGYSG